MELDDLREAWTEQFAGLEHRLDALEGQLARGGRRRARRALLPGLGWHVVEVVAAIALLAALVPPLFAHRGEWRYVVCGGAVVVVLLGFGGASLGALVRAARIDFARPVVAIQRDVARLHRAEFVALGWGLAGGIVVWLPLALLLFEAASGIAVLAHVDGAWLFANPGCGLVLLGVAIGAARRMRADPGRRPWLDRVAAALSGRGLRRARELLDEVGQFERGRPE